MINRKKFFKITSFLLLLGGILFFRIAFAQDYGIDQVASGLDGSLGETNSDPRETAGRIINFALGFLGILAVGIILYGGFKWMTSGGNEEKVSEAKKILVAGVIGLVIILASWGIASFLINRISGVISGDNWGYNSGDTQACGCGGYMVWNNGSFGACIGSDCRGCYGAGCGPVSCDGSALPGCQATDQICGEGNYCDNSCLCRPLGQAGDSCNRSSSGSTCQADDALCGAYLTCSPDSCTCIGSPVIIDISPAGGFCQNEQNKSCKTDADCSDTCNLSAPNGATGNFLTITGRNFGSYDADKSKVIFLGSGTEKEADRPNIINPDCISFWRSDQIIIAIPAGAATGPIKVVAADSLFDTTNNDYGPIIPDFRSNSIVRPGLCEIDPIRGQLSSEVSYSGVNLFSGEAYFGNYQTNVRGLVSDFSDPKGLQGLSATPNIRAGESGSFVQATLNGSLEKSNFLTFVKEKEPNEGAFISSFSPSSGNTGQYVTIYGSGFGGAKGNRKVFFGDIEASYDFPEVCLNSVWKDNQIMVKVPKDLNPSDYVIKIELGDKTVSTDNLNPKAFTFDQNIDLKTSLCKIDPIRGPTLTKVAIWGEYFGAPSSEVSIKFNGSDNVSAIVKKDGRADKVETSVPENSITGPVRIFKNGVYGNDLNFSVGACISNSDCGSQVCCPAGTFKKGMCVNTLDKCYVDVPSSVYEWSFSTAFSNPETEADSCAGLSKYYGFCNVGACPNASGICSPYAGGDKIFGVNCSYDCSSVAGCRIGENNCTYNTNLDKCLQNLENEQEQNCDLDQSFEYELNGQALSTKLYCNENGRLEINLTSSCPEGFIRGVGDKCYNPTSTCSSCDYGLKCENINGFGRCISNKLCPSGSICESESDSSVGRCVSTKSASCDCCCTVGQSARDCCSFQNKDGEVVQLQCGGTCGSDTTNDDSGLGRCSGCAAAGDTALERDAACNCSGTSGQFCEVNDSSFPNGYCTDCASLSPEACLEHANVCCLDSASGICRGGKGNLISDNPLSEDFGYCAYYNCSATESNVCASNYPVKTGSYLSLEKCETECALSDPCSALEGFDACSAEASGRCCFDAKESKCTLGEVINDGNPENQGYCAYYDCKEEEKLCASETKLKTGNYKGIKECESACANPISGVGLSCSVSGYFGIKDPYVCDTSLCSAPGFSCMAEGGVLGSATSGDCGTCCCQPVTTPGAFDSCQNINPNLSCIADRGNCAGAERGLCCGCETDEQCGSPELVGCGNDTCCETRPTIVSSFPAHLSDNVCRNAILKFSFNQLMDQSSLDNNIVLIEERSFGDGICPNGSFVASAESLKDAIAYNNNFFARIENFFRVSVRKIASLFSPSLSNRALAEKPSEDKLYCMIPGKAFLENTAEASTVNFLSNTILSPSTNYYLLVLGDENLNSQTGILSLKGVGFNGRGYPDASIPSGFLEAENIKFNEKSFKNSEIIKFSTLSSQSAMSGICAISNIDVKPISYLFKTTDNALESEEKDIPGSGSFDSKADKDKVWSAFALSSDGQSLRPVGGYFWDYKFTIADETIAKGERLNGLPLNQYFVSAQKGITDGKTKINASIDMSRFIANTPGSTCNSDATCSCSNDICEENCCNYYSAGNNFNKNADIFVFICNNPWPAISRDGLWSPWYDSVNNCTIGESDCGNFNYSFYYCRDAGTSGTYDDLPAVLNEPVIIGRNNNLICSSDRPASCNNVNDRCGDDRNGDGVPDGICIWNVLKESYFFREKLPSSGRIIEALDLKTSGQVKISWESNADQVDAYKIYYIRAGKSEISFREIKANNTDICSLNNNIYSCSAIVSGLDNGFNYAFRIGVVSVNKAESPAANEKIAMPTDKTAPSVPQNLEANPVGENSVRISWQENNDDTSFYRIYIGLRPGLYGKSFDSPVKKSGEALNNLVFSASEFSFSGNYIAISAIDGSGNESSKSEELLFIPLGD